MEFKLCTCRRKVNKISEILRKLQTQGLKNSSAEFDFDIAFVEDSINDLLGLEINFPANTEALAVPDMKLNEIFLLMVEVESYIRQLNKSITISKLFESKKSRRSKLEELINNIFVKFGDFLKILLETLKIDLSKNEGSIPSKKVIKYQEGEMFWSSKFGSGTLVVDFPQFCRGLKAHLQCELTEEEVERLRQILDPEATGVHMFLFSEFLKGFGPLQLIIQNVNRVLTSPWFHGYLAGGDCNRLLGDSPPKTYLIRFSQSNPGSFALAFVDSDKKVKQFKINPKNTPGEFGFTISELQFSTLNEIIAHFANRGLLSIPFSSKIQEEDWFFGEMKVEEAQDMLEDKPPGTFVIRFGRNSSFTGSYVDDKGIIRHAAITHVGMGRYQIANLSTQAPVFNNLPDLIKGHGDLFRKPLTVSKEKMSEISQLVEKLIQIDEVRNGDPLGGKSGQQVSLWDKENAQNLYSLPDEAGIEGKKSARGHTELYEIIPESEKETNVEMTLGTGKIFALFPKNVQKDSLTSRNLLKISESGELIAGKLEVLVEFLLKEQTSGDYINVFLLTYRSYTSPLKLLELLKNIYSVHASGKDLEKNKFIRLRVCNFLKHWANEHFDDFKGEQELIHSFLSFVEEIILVLDGEGLAEQLRNLMKKKLQEKENLQKKIMFSSDPPLPIFPKENFTLFDVNPIELARQITIYEFSHYKMIQAKECLGLAWMKPNSETKAPNIMEFINHFNQFGFWIQHSILSKSDVKERASVIEFFATVSQHLIDLQNFNGAMEIYSGLNSTAISRLKKTFEQVNPSTTKQMQQVEELMARKGNFKAYRETIRTRALPLLPYLGLFLSDLTFIEEGNPNLVDDNLINMAKCQLIAKIVVDLQFFQQSYFNLWPITAIQRMLKQIGTYTEKELYDMSLVVEPRAGATPAPSSAPSPTPPTPTPAPAPAPTSAPVPVPAPSSLTSFKENSSSGSSLGTSLSSSSGSLPTASTMPGDSPVSPPTRRDRESSSWTRSQLPTPEKKKTLRADEVGISLPEQPDLKDPKEEKKEDRKESRGSLIGLHPLGPRATSVATKSKSEKNLGGLLSPRKEGKEKDKEKDKDKDKDKDSPPRSKSPMRLKK